MFVEHNDPVELAKEIFWLAWNGCNGPLGMGVFQNRPSATKENVWDNIVNQGDYPCNLRDSTKPYADYVFGRMMKIGLSIKENGVEIRDFEPRSDYQSWGKVYPTVQDLVNAALNNLN